MGLKLHHNFHTGRGDLGWENQVLWNITFSGSPSSSFNGSGLNSNNLSDHTSFIYWLLSPIYYLFPCPEFLIILQSIITGLGAFIVFLLAKNVIKNQLSAFLVFLIYTLYPAIQGINLYAFHPSTFIICFGLLLFLFYEKKQWKLFTILFFLSSLVREDVILYLIFLSLYMIIHSYRLENKNDVKKGILFLITSLFLFYTSTLVMKFLGGSLDYNPYRTLLYPNIPPSIFSIFLTIIFKPIYFLKTLIIKEKIEFLLYIFTPLFFLPLIEKPYKLILLLPGLITTVLASDRGAMYTIGYHYVALLIPPIFYLTIKSYSYFIENKTMLKLWLPSFLIVFSLLNNYLYGYIFSRSIKSIRNCENNSDFAINGGWNSVYYNLQEPFQKNEIRALQEIIPINAKVSASECIIPHLSGRKNIEYYPENFQNSDYIIFFKDESDHFSAENQRKLKESRYKLLEKIGDILIFYRSI